MIVVLVVWCAKIAGFSFSEGLRILTQKPEEETGFLMNCCYGLSESYLIHLIELGLVTCVSACKACGTHVLHVGLVQRVK